LLPKLGIEHTTLDLNSQSSAIDYLAMATQWTLAKNSAGINKGKTIQRRIKKLRKATLSEIAKLVYLKGN